MEGNLNLRLSESCAGRQKVKWTESQEEAFLEAVKKYGEGKWALILADENVSHEFRDKTTMQLKDKWRNIKARIIQKARAKKQAREGLPIRRPVPIGGGMEIPIEVQNPPEIDKNEDNNNVRKFVSKIKMPGDKGYRKRPLVELLSDTEGESSVEPENSASNSSDDELFLFSKRRNREKETKKRSQLVEKRYLEQKHRIEAFTEDIKAMKEKLGKITNELSQCANVLPVRKIYEQVVQFENDLHRVSHIFEPIEEITKDSANSNTEKRSESERNDPNRTSDKDLTNHNTSQSETDELVTDFAPSPKTRAQKKKAAASKIKKQQSPEKERRRSSGIGILSYIFPGMVETNATRKQASVQNGVETRSMKSTRLLRRGKRDR